MKRVIRRSPQVESDIVGIYRYLSDRSPRSAERVLDAIERSVRRLLETPGVGRHWNSPHRRLEGMRVTTVTPYRNYLIFFRATATAIEVFRITHAARDLDRLIEDLEFDTNV